VLKHQEDHQYSGGIKEEGRIGITSPSLLISSWRWK